MSRRHSCQRVIVYGFITYKLVTQIYIYVYICIYIYIYICVCVCLCVCACVCVGVFKHFPMMREIW